MTETEASSDRTSLSRNKIRPARPKNEPQRRQRVTLALFIVLLSACLLTGCSAPKRAVVVSLEQPGGKGKGWDKRSGYAYHRVLRGDTLYTIAWRYGLDYPDLASWNGIRYPYTIYPGQRLRLTRPPASKAKPTTATSRKPAKPVSAKNRTAAAGNPKQDKTPARPRKSSTHTDDNRELSWRWPTQGKVLQRYAGNDPGRKGIKIGGRLGQAVRAAESGKVVYAGSGLIGYGRLIIIKHNKNYLSAYGHNRKLLVKEGMAVARGQRVALMGAQGDGRPRLHFEIRRNGVPVDPVRLLPQRR